jgi:hypothetical protein
MRSGSTDARSSATQMEAARPRAHAIRLLPTILRHPGRKTLSKSTIRGLQLWGAASRSGLFVVPNKPLMIGGLGRITASSEILSPG